MRYDDLLTKAKMRGLARRSLQFVPYLLHYAPGLQ